MEHTILNKTWFGFGACVIAATLFLGAGCQKNAGTAQAPDVVTGPKPASFEGLSPAEATKKIVLIPSSVIKVRQSFSDAGQALVAEMGWGSSLEREVVIKRFAPGNSADIDWKLNTDVQTKEGKNEHRQQEGAITGIGLKNSVELALPALWTQGTHSAGGASGIWLSADVFENLTKAQASTLRIGVANKELAGLLDTPKGVQKSLETVRAAVQAESSKKDIDYATASIEPIRTDVNANGSRVTVEAIQVKSWYGAITVLNNQQNPIVLKFVPSKEFEAKGMAGFFGFEVTDFKDIQE